MKVIVDSFPQKGRKLFAAFWNLEKVYGGTDRKGLRDVLRIYEDICCLFERIGIGVRSKCAMTPWRLNICKCGCMRGMKARVMDLSARPKMRDKEYPWQQVCKYR